MQASRGHRVQLKVYDSVLEGDSLLCKYDVVVVRDGKNLYVPFTCKCTLFSIIYVESRDK